MIAKVARGNFWSVKGVGVNYGNARGIKLFFYLVSRCCLKCCNRWQMKLFTKKNNGDIFQIYTHTVPGQI